MFGSVHSGCLVEVFISHEIFCNFFCFFHCFSPKSEKAKCWKIIDEYLANYPVPRDISTPHAVIFQGLEPSTFIGYFHQWDKKFWDVSAVSVCLCPITSKQ